MKSKSEKRSWTLLALTAVVCGGCGSQAELESVGSTTPSYDEFKQSMVWSEALGAHLYEGDIPFYDEEQMQAYYAQELLGRNSLIIDTIGTNGPDNKWSSTARWTIKYCVSSSGFGVDYDSVVLALRAAAGYWENAVDVRFVHVSSEDANCTNTNNKVTFNVAPTTGNYYSAFFPDYPRSERQVFVNWPYVWPAPLTRRGVLTHELGHTLGFRHEHIRPGASCAGGEDDNSWRQLTPLDRKSVMHYPASFSNCPGTNTGDLEITQWDREGAMKIYQGPTTVLAKDSTTIYAAKRSNGDMYKKVGSGSWTRIGGPGKQFLMSQGKLLGLAPDGSAIYEYQSGTSWTLFYRSPLSDVRIAQMFNCRTGVCYTNDGVGDIYAIAGTQNFWKLGGPGRVWASTTNDIFGLSSDGTQIWKYEGALNWSLWANVNARTIVADDNYVYSDDEANGVWRYTAAGSRQRINLPTVRQIVGGTGTTLYALTGDAQEVRMVSGSAPSTIGGAAARIYTNAGVVLATNPSTGDIYRYNGGSSWTPLGRP